MKTNYPPAFAVNRIKLTALALAAGVILAQSGMSAGPAPIDLKSCSNFAILAYSTITSTGGGMINGDVGLSPAGSQQIPLAQINGNVYNGGPIAAQAQVDLSDAIVAASPAGLPGGIDVGNGELGGRTLAPGVYKSAPGSYGITLVDLTLDGGPDDVWVFQMASTLIVEVGRQVILTGGARAKNVFWQVGSSATLGTSSVFHGTIMAYASVTMNASSVMSGRALAQTGAVTFNGTSGSLPSKTSQTITNFMPTNGSVFAGTNIVGLSAQASSGLPVAFTRLNGPGVLTGGTNLVFISTGLVRIVASQAGDADYLAAEKITNTFTVIPPLSTEPGGLEIQVTPVSGSWRLTAPEGYAGPTSGTGNLAAVSAVIGEYTIAYGALSGYLLPTNHNQAQFVISGVTSLFAGVYRQISTDIASPVITATKGTYTNRIQVTWPSVPGVTGYEIWKSETDDAAVAICIAEVPDYGTEVFQVDDYDVLPVHYYYYWGVAKTATNASPMSSASMGYVGLPPTARVIRDYDGDGKSDLALYRDGNWAIFLMAGSFLEGGWGGPDWTPVSGDYDGDRKGDVAVYRDGIWKIFLMTGSILEGGWGGPDWTTASGDFDGDGKSDVAVYRDGIWEIYLMAGSILEGGWGGPDWITVPGDYDGDGKSDLAVYRDGYWMIYLMTGDILEGGWGGPDWIPVSGDYDGDGKSDLAVYRDGNWEIFLMSGGFLEGVWGGPDWIPVRGDYDGDGKSDVAVYRDGNWAIFLMSGRILEGFWGGPDWIPVQ